MHFKDPYALLLKNPRRFKMGECPNFQAFLSSEVAFSTVFKGSSALC
jgi:hypothetical protein